MKEILWMIIVETQYYEAQYNGVFEMKTHPN